MERTPTSLQELAQLVIDVQGTSARQVALRAEAKGLKLTDTTLNQMKSGSYKFVPREDTVRALAELAGISVEAAFHAAGLPVPGPPLADELPPGSDNLSPKSRAAVIQMLRVLIDLESNHDEHTEHEEQPDAREREEPDGAAPARGGGARGGDARAGEKTAAPAGVPAPEDAGVRPEDLDLAAHPYMELSRDRQDAAWGDVGEESQDPGDEAGA
ncbi:hypothetical protein AB0302_04620 [Micrococcus sp. NPDC078436]|uniref:hypothetical protein n=1 Tax=Micrococcus sp. NPDC078436 TaxID=3154960 RepID=UPI00344DB40B